MFDFFQKAPFKMLTRAIVGVESRVERPKRCNHGHFFTTVYSKYLLKYTKSIGEKVKTHKKLLEETESIKDRARKNK